MNGKLKELRKKSMALPLTPGVYIMKNQNKEIIYIGKAKALKNRVSQYFGSQNTHTIKVRKMVDNVDDFDYILCDSEFEALVLECSLIKQHSPKYNILLKDDKGYSYIKIYGEQWKNFDVVFQKDDDHAKYIGPYTSSYGITNQVDSAKKVFMIPQCSKVFPRDYGKSKPCLNYHIGQCSAPCAAKISREDYEKSVEEALDYIMYGTGKVLEELKKKMIQCSENLDYERAAKYRDKIRSIEKTDTKQKVFDNSVEEQDVFAIVNAGDEGNGKSCLAVLRFKDGRLYDNDQYIIDTPEDVPETRAELVRSYYTTQDYIPKRITLDGECEDSELISLWLSEKSGHKVALFIPQKGVQHDLVEMCRSNAAQKLAIYLGRSGKATAALDELAQLLGLQKPPKYIESYDISHTAGSDNVAGMVVFQNGVPCKKMYKKFAIKGFTGQDDYASMAEVLDRRLTEYENAENKDEGFGILPDLILLDGGKGQVSAVVPVLKKHNIDIPLFGMVKDSHHRTRAIATGGEELALTSKRSAFTLVSTIQEEVHRYSVAYHHQKHKKSSISTTLTSIEGIGETRAKSLLKYFKTIKAISEASEAELSIIKGMTKESARNVFAAFHGSEKNC